MSAVAFALIRSAIARQFLAFTAVGAVGTGVHYVTLIAGVSAGVDPVVASGFGWAFGAVANYLLNYHLTFRSRLAHRRSMPRFALVSGTGLLLNTLLMIVGIDWLALHYLVAQVIATGTTLCWNFALSRIWAFKASPRDASPRELATETRAFAQTGPQPVLRHLKSAVALWLCVALVAAGSAGFVAGVRGWHAGARIAERGVFEAAAAINGKAIAPVGNAHDASTRYLARYRFTAKDGTRFEGSEEVSLEPCESVAEGKPVAICYLPSHSADGPARPGRPWWMWPLLSGIAGGVAVLGAALAGPGVLRLQAISRVQRSGTDARATVIDVAPIYTRLDRGRHWRIRYEFTDGLGRTQAGNSELMSPREAAQWSIGDGVAVRFDPHAPRNNCWLGTRVS